MAKIVNSTFFGLPCIIRHDYEDTVIKEKLKNYQKKSVDAALKFCTNVPNFKYDLALDVGCGDDNAIKLLNEKFKTTLGVDLYVEENEYINIYKEDWYELAKHFSKETFDLMFINHSLEHADSPYKLMQQVSHLQNKGGVLFIAVPDGNSPFGYSITSSTTHFSCITEGFLNTLLQRFGYNVYIERIELRHGAPELWAYAIKQYDSFPL